MVFICNVCTYIVLRFNKQFWYPSAKKGKSLDLGFYKYLPFWFTSGWRSSMSSCFFCNSSWTSVSFSLRSGKNMMLWSQTDLRMNTNFLPLNICGLWVSHFLILTFLNCEMGITTVKYYGGCCEDINWMAYDGCQKCKFFHLPSLLPKRVKGNIL